MEVNLKCDYYRNGVDEDNNPLAQIVKVLSLDSIPNANSIELAHVLGWQCVVKKDEFKIGDLAIYFAIDSILDPNNENSKFLDGKRLKTRMILSTLSQGLLTPLHWLKSYQDNINNLKEGDNVTNIMKVKKYVFNEELKLYNQHDESIPKKITFPEYVPKTDENRVQNVPKVLRDIVGKEIVITRKEDGTSTTYIYYNGNFLICGRNQCHDEKNGSNKHYYEIEARHKIGENMKILGRNIAIQGEIVGPKINGNRLKLRDIEYRVFNIWDIDEQYYLIWEEVEEITSKLNLNTVPVIFKGVMGVDLGSVNNLLKLAESLEYTPGNPAEGIVVKTNYKKEQPRHSFKVISNKFLLNYKL